MENRFDDLAKELSRERVLKLFSTSVLALLTLSVPVTADARHKKRKRGQKKHRRTKPVDPNICRVLVLPNDQSGLTLDRPCIGVNSVCPPEGCCVCPPGCDCASATFPGGAIGCACYCRAGANLTVISCPG